jgi:hypothetical protein
VLCGVGAGIVDPSFGFIRIIQSCFVGCATHSFSFVSVVRLISFMCVGWSSLNHSYVIQIQISSSIYRARGTRPWDSSSIGDLRTSIVRHIASVYQTGLLLQQCIQPATSDVNIFAIYHYIFITIRSSYNVLCYHTMLAGALWGIKCDKQALPLRPVF